MFDENNPMPPGFKLIEGYNCPDCDRALTVWTNKRDGEQAKCRMCKKEHDIKLLEKKLNFNLARNSKHKNKNGGIDGGHLSLRENWREPGLRKSYYLK